MPHSLDQDDQKVKRTTEDADLARRMFFKNFPNSNFYKQYLYVNASEN